MEIRQLKCLIAIAKQQHVGRAADDLHITQPALSQQLRKLEEEVGTPLFERHARGMRLTAAGKVLIEYATDVLDKLLEAKEAIKALTMSIDGRVTVGVLHTVSSHVMPRAISQLIDEFPNVQVSLQELSEEQIENAIADGVIDVGIGFVPPERDDLVYEALFTEEMKLIMARPHAFYSSDGVDIRLLNERPMALLSNQFRVRQFLEEVLQQAGVIPRVVVESNTVSSLLEVVLMTGLPTVLPELAVSRCPVSLLARVRLRNPSPSRIIGLLWQRSGIRTAASRALAMRLRAAFSPLPSTSSLMQ